jgi:hypothetical protein
MNPVLTSKPYQPCTVKIEFEFEDDWVAAMPRCALTGKDR